MPERDPETGAFVKSANKAGGTKLMSHPALRPPKKREKRQKQRRTIVRTIKLVNASNDVPVLIEVPIEPGHNNRGTLKDPTLPIRHYLDKGFVLPHEFDGEVFADFGDGPKAIDLQVIFCAVSGCWKKATATDDPDDGTERCPEHNSMYDKGEIRYAMSGKGGE